jgi:FAD:protein FMN transferase
MKPVDVRRFRGGVPLAGWLLLVVAACSPQGASREQVEVDGLAMGTSWSVKLAAPPSTLDREALGKAVAARIEAIEQAMSTYRQDSELSRFNAHGGQDWFAVSPELCFVVASALSVSRRSGGAFDVTVGPLVELWGFGSAAPRAAPPEAARIAAVQRDVGYHKLRADCARPALRKTSPGVQVDLSAIAKGYAVDAVAELLDAQGYGNYLVEIGGEVRARGRNGSAAPWAIGIEAPDRGRRAVERIVRLDNMAMATSGDYRNFFAYDGVYYSHTIDPRTGAPTQHALAEVSVVTTSTTDADAWATALLVLGTTEGRRLADELGLAVLFQERGPDGTREVQTAAFAALAGPR